MQMQRWLTHNLLMRRTHELELDKATGGVCKVLEAEKAGKPTHGAWVESARIDRQIRAGDLLKAQVVDLVDVQFSLKMFACD